MTEVVKPIAYENDGYGSSKAREEWLERVCNTVGVDYTAPAKSLADELRELPNVGQVLMQAQQEGKTLKDIEHDLMLALLASMAVSQYDPAMRQVARTSDDFKERRASIEAAVYKHATKVYKDAAKALAKLPADPFDRDAVFDTDTTVEAKTLATALDTLNDLVGIQGGKGIPHGKPERAVLRYVTVEEGANTYRFLTDWAAKVSPERLLVGVIRGEYEGVTATLPTREQAVANFEILQRNERARRNRVAQASGHPVDWTGVARMGQPNPWRGGA